MRKPLVVVGLTASALVLTVGVAATRAGAEETPDGPGLPGFTMPDFLGWPAFPDDADVDDDSGDPSAMSDTPDTDRPGGGAPVRPRPATQRPAAGGTLNAAARRDVTADDVSSSPDAPVQRQILALVNQGRRRGGCDDLSVDRRLIDAANEHAADMARRDYFAHESPNGDGAGDRVREQGYRWKRYGENIARGVDSPYEVVDGWMHSPAHRENILDCRLHQMGVGLAIARDHTAYWVQDFATPMT